MNAGCLGHRPTECGWVPLNVVGSGQSRTYMVNGLSEFSTDGGPITWTVDYLYMGSRLLGAVRPAPGSVYTLTVTKLRDGAGCPVSLPVSTVAPNARLAMSAVQG